MFLLGLFPFFLKLVGTGVIQSTLGTLLDAKQKLSETANASEKNKLDAQISTISYELQLRQAQRDLQIKELDHWWMTLPKFLIMFSVACYVVARFLVKTWGLEDFHIAVQDLNVWEAGVASLVMTYMFLGKHISKALGD